MLKKFFILYAVCLLFVSCAGTRGLQKQDAEYITENSRNIGRIEGTVQSLGETISDSRERLEIVGRASARIRDASERLDYLITEYELEVERILNEIDSLRAELEKREKGKVGSFIYTDTRESVDRHMADIER